MRTKRTRGKSRNISKTERIANVFTSRPLDSISPKEISRELDLEIQLVTSIVSRLKAEGLIERIGWGKYKLRMEQTVDDDVLRIIAKNLYDISRNIVGSRQSRKLDEDLDQPFKFLIEVYKQVISVGGENMANNLLKLAARKELDDTEVEYLVYSIKEVALE